MYFIVEGLRGKQRPRFNSRTHTTYTPAKTTRFESAVAKAFKVAGGVMIPGDGYVSVRIDSYYSIPKSYSKAKRKECLLGTKRPTRKPDIDNVVKLVLDALNGVAYKDDSKVVHIESWKKFSATGGDYITVEVTEVKSD